MAEICITGSSAIKIGIHDTALEAEKNEDAIGPFCELYRKAGVRYAVYRWLVPVVYATLEDGGDLSAGRYIHYCRTLHNEVISQLALCLRNFLTFSLVLFQLFLGDCPPSFHLVRGVHRGDPIGTTKKSGDTCIRFATGK